MDEKTVSTLERIQQAALDEFAEKGFLGASLRQIVKNAGVTTGAFYGYFSSKEALFASSWNLMPPPLWAGLWKPRLPSRNCPKNSSRITWA